MTKQQVGLDIQFRPAYLCTIDSIFHSHFHKQKILYPMGRSVMTYGNNNIYIGLDNDNMECHDWDYFYENLLDVIQEKYPSLDSIIDEDKFYGREGRIIARNNHSEIIVCSYFNLVSVNICVQDDAYEYNLENIAQRWCDSVENNIAKLLQKAGYNVLNRVGTFSNGCSVYEKAS